MKRKKIQKKFKKKYGIHWYEDISQYLIFCEDIICSFLNVETSEKDKKNKLNENIDNLNSSQHEKEEWGKLGHNSTLKLKIPINDYEQGCINTQQPSQINENGFKVELDTESLISLIMSIQPPMNGNGIYPSTDPLIEKCGYMVRNENKDEWIWDESYIKTLNREELLKLFNLCCTI